MAQKKKKKKCDNTRKPNVKSRKTNSKRESKEMNRIKIFAEKDKQKSRAYTHLSRPWCMFSHHPLSRSLSRTHTGSCRGCSHRSVSTPSRYCWHIHQCLTQEQRVKVWGTESWQSSKDVIFAPQALYGALLWYQPKKQNLTPIKSTLQQSGRSDPSRNTHTDIKET